MSYSLPSPPSKPGVITAIETLLWTQAGLGFIQCWCNQLISYAVSSGSYHAGDRPGPEFVLGALLFGLLVVAATPQLAVIAAKLTTGGPAARRGALRVWALWVLAAPLLVLALFGLVVVFDSDLIKMEAPKAVATMAVFHAPVPIAAIWCLLTPTARAWFHRRQPVSDDDGVISWWD